MKRKEGPRLYVLVRPAFDVEEFLRFLEDEGTGWRRTEGATGTEEIVEVAGRLCYMSFGDAQSSKGNGEYITNLVKQGHESVLEHVVWGFVLTGVSRALTHQLVRHRVGFAFSQLSQQYHEETRTSAVIPALIASRPPLQARWLESILQSQRTYRDLLSSLEEAGTQGELRYTEPRELRRAIRSAARSVLPEGTETKIFFTANARAIRHFLTLRGGIEGDEEMRCVSALVLKAVQREAPALFRDFTCEEDEGLPLVKRVTSQ